MKQLPFSFDLKNKNNAQRVIAKILPIINLETLGEDMDDEYWIETGTEEWNELLNNTYNALGLKPPNFGDGNEENKKLGEFIYKALVLAIKFKVRKELGLKTYIS